MVIVEGPQSMPGYLAPNLHARVTNMQHDHNMIVIGLSPSEQP
jgi:hypothetical protein